MYITVFMYCEFKTITFVHQILGAGAGFVQRSLSVIFVCAHAAGQEKTILTFWQNKLNCAFETLNVLRIFIKKNICAF